MKRRTSVLLFFLMLLGQRAAFAQDLQPTLERVAAAWHRGDVGGIAALSARAGISLNIDGATVGPLPARQAAAVLRRVFEDRESVGAKVNMSRQVGAERNQAFGEISWSTRARGTTIPERATVFVAFVREDNGWRVAEIRLLR